IDEGVLLVNVNGNLTIENGTYNEPSPVVISKNLNSVTLNGVGGAVIINQSVDITSTVSQFNLAGNISLQGLTTSATTPVTLISNTNLNANGNPIVFGDTVNGGFNLVLSGSNTTFNNAVGNTTRLANLTINGAISANGGAISTTGNQIYNGTLTLGTALTLN